MTPDTLTLQVTTYTDIFTSYIVNAACEALGQVQQSAGQIPEEVRAQAWHLLDYALGVDAAWPHVRELLLTLSPKMEMAGHREEWLPFLRTGIERSAARQDRAVEARLSLAIGQLLRLQNRYAEADEWITRVLHSFQQQNDLRSVAAAYNQLGRICYLQHRDADAVQYAQAALDFLAEEDPERAESHFVLGMAALNQRDWETAERNHRLALEIRQRTGDRRTIAWAMQNIGVTLLQQSEYGGVDRLREAAQWLEEAITILDSLPDPYHSAIARNSLALVYSQSSRLQDAAALYCQAEEIFQTTHSPEWLARVDNNLGLVYLRNGEPVDAERSFRAGVVLYEQLGNDAARLNTQHGVVLALLGQQRYAEAVALCAKGLAELDVLRHRPAEYAEKEGWYRASLAKAKTALGQ